MLAGVRAAVERPYTASTIWDLLQGSAHALDDYACVTFGPIELDARAYTVRLHGQRIPDLPLKEFEMLRALLYRAPEVLTNEELRGLGVAQRGAAAQEQHSGGIRRTAAHPAPGGWPPSGASAVGATRSPWSEQPQRVAPGG